MKKIIKWSILIVLVIPVVLVFISSLFSGSNESEQTQPISIEKIEEKNPQDKSKYPEGFISVKSMSELNGNWSYSDDLLKINSNKKFIQFNDGMKFYLDSAYHLEYNQFYIYGRVKDKNGNALLRARVRLSSDKQKLHLERLDGNISNIYTKN
jgi:hypothetical protein